MEHDMMEFMNPFARFLVEWNGGILAYLIWVAIILAVAYRHTQKLVKKFKVARANKADACLKQ